MRLDMSSEEEIELSLSSIWINERCETLWLNGDGHFRILLNRNIMRQKPEEQRRILTSLLLSGCDEFKLYYGGEDNLKKLVADGLGQIAKRKYEEAVAAREERRQQKEEEEQAAPKPKEEPERQIELTPELTREISFDETSDIFSISIKRHKAAKLIAFSGMLLAQTNKDQLNIGFQAESAAGKSYIPLELASYFPQNEVMKIAQASPTSFYHRGEWDESRKAKVCDLERKIIIFLDMPHFQLLERLRPVLSHDDKELKYSITDHSQKHGLRTKDVFIRGFPSVFFCTARPDPDEQEKTRMILLSPETDQQKLMESLMLAALRNADSNEYRKLIEQDPKRKWLIDRILAIRQLGIREIIVPDGGKIVLERFIQTHGHLIARHQRDLPRIFAFIKTNALLNSFNRNRLTNGKSGTIAATDVDIEAGFALYKEIEESNELGLSPYIYRIYTEVIKPNLNANGLSRKEIRSKYFSVFHKSLSTKFEDAIIEQLEAAGLVQQVPDPEDRRKLLVLPSPTNLIEPTKNISPDTMGVQNEENESTPIVKGDISLMGSIKEITNKIIGDKGFFTKAEWMTTLMLLPRRDPLYCDENLAEQMLQGLKDDNMIEEFEEPGKYRSTEKLRETGGD